PILTIHHSNPLTPTPPTPLHLHSFPTRRSSDLGAATPLLAAPGEFISGKKHDDGKQVEEEFHRAIINAARNPGPLAESTGTGLRSEEHTSELQSLAYLVCRLLLEKKKQ